MFALWWAKQGGIRKFDFPLFFYESSNMGSSPIFYTYCFFESYLLNFLKIRKETGEILPYSFSDVNMHVHQVFKLYVKLVRIFFLYLFIYIHTYNKSTCNNDLFSC